MFTLGRKGQNTLEYVLLITAVITAFLLVQHYLSRGMQGKVRDSADNIGGQFDAKDTTSSFRTERSSMVKETTAAGVTRSQLISPEHALRTGSEIVGAVQQEESAQAE